MPFLREHVGNWAIFLFLACSLPPALALLHWFPIVSRNATAAAATKLSGFRKAAIIATLSLYYLAIGAYWPFVGEVGKKAGLSYLSVSSVLGFAAIASIVGSAVAVLFGDRRDARWTMRILFIAQVLSILIPLVEPQSQVLFRFSACLFAFTWFALFPFLLGMMSRLDPSGRLNALLYVIAAAAFAAGPGFAGWLIGRDHATGTGLIELQWISLGNMTISTIALALIGQQAARWAANGASLKEQ
jgi:MFS family permease